MQESSQISLFDQGKQELVLAATGAITPESITEAQAEPEQAATETELAYAQPNYPYYRTDPVTGVHTEITRSEYKKAMHDEFTVKHPVNPTCSHSITIGYPPRHRNCESCWFAYFQVHGEVTKLADEIFQEHGKDQGAQIITRIKGRKFFNNFLKFMSTVAHFKQELEAAKEQDEQRTLAVEGVDVGTEPGRPTDDGAGPSVQAGGAEESS